MSKVDSARSRAAKASGQVGGLHNQRRAGESVTMQDRLVELVVKHPGYTLDQLSWIAAGFWVDDKGFCQPSEKYKQAQDYFNFKRRGSEIAQHPWEKVKSPEGVEHMVALSDADVKSKHPKARLVYTDASNNPYSEKGGRGVRKLVLGSSSAAVSVVDPAITKPAANSAQVAAEVKPTHSPVQPVANVAKSKPDAKVSRSYVSDLSAMLED